MAKRPDDLERAKALEAKASKLRDNHNAKTARRASKDVRRIERTKAALEGWSESLTVGDVRLELDAALQRERAKVKP